MSADGKRVVELPAGGFIPRKYQRGPMGYIDHGGKRCVCVWHRRAGKDLCFVHQTAKEAHKRVGIYWHMFPTFAYGKRVLWEAKTKDGVRILDQAFPGFLDSSSPGSIVSKVNQSECIVEFKNGSVWRLMGSDKTDNVGAGPVGVVFSEYALMHPLVWDFIRPMLRENGGWAAFIFTPRGKNHGYEIYKIASKTEGWYLSHKNIHQTGLLFHSSRSPDLMLTPEQLLVEETEEGMEEALIEQEYLVDFEAANVGSIFGKLMAKLRKVGGVCNFLHPSDGIFTSWDLGISDSTAIWFWRLKDDGVDFVDYYEAHGHPMSHYFDLLREWSRPIARGGKGYEYVQHWLPHDSKARTLATGVSIFNLFIDELKREEEIDGKKVRALEGQLAVTPSLSLVDGIQAARWLLQQATRFHERCSEHKGIEAAEQYQYEFDEEKRIFSNKPRHDWTSHGADALRYTAIVVRRSNQVRLARKIEEEPGPAAAPASGTFTLDQLWKLKDKHPKLRRHR